MNLICPRDHLPLINLQCPHGHQYFSFEGIPILLLDDVPETIWTYTRSLQQAKGRLPIHADWRGYISELIGSAGGHLYDHLANNLREYPIPEIPVAGSGTLLDVGCNWGRWAISAARKGFKVTGIDSALDALWAAKNLCAELGVDAEFICADARYLPFPGNSFDHAFSFSVLQHFSKSDARLAFAEMKRVARKSKVEIPGKYGIRAFQHQLGRRFREPSGFEVRYWTPAELSKLGNIEVHAYFGTGIVSSDVHLMPLKYKAVIHASELLTKLSRAFPPLRKVADSYYVTF